MINPPHSALRRRARELRDAAKREQFFFAVNKGDAHWKTYPHPPRLYPILPPTLPVMGRIS